MKNYSQSRQRDGAMQPILFTRAHVRPERMLLQRVLIVLLLLGLAVAVLWWDRAGIKDNIDGEMSLLDVVYFTAVTITTVGYGDIVPASDRARLIDTIFINPIRLVIWFIFLGTAYQLVVQKILEDYRMARLQRSLRAHIVICGYGHTGRSAALELLAKGEARDRIVVIDTAQAMLEEAASDGVIALRGDAAREDILRQANVGTAKAVIVTPGRDDTAVLTVLTVRHVNPAVRVIAGVKKEENARLLKQSGANVTISSSKVGGYMLADAVDRTLTVEYLYDLMTAGGQVNLVERAVRAHEVGHVGRNLGEEIIVRVQRGRDAFGFWEIEGIALALGDVLLLMVRGSGPASPS